MFPPETMQTTRPSPAEPGNRRGDREACRALADDARALEQQPHACRGVRERDRECVRDERRARAPTSSAGARPTRRRR